MLRNKFEEDAEWYPGKVSMDSQQPGRPKVITSAQENAIATSAMAVKARGMEPSVSMVIAHGPKATLNPGTNGPCSAKVILDVFKTRCYDDDPDKPWSHLPPSHRTALSPELKVSREEWAETMLSKGHQSRWYLNHCDWLDPCSTIVPGSKKTAFDHQQANFGKRKRWMSSGSKHASRNMRPSPYAGKQAHWGDKRVWWFIVFAKGRVHLEIMPDVGGGMGRAGIHGQPVA